MNADTRRCGETSIGFVHNISHTSGRHVGNFAARMTAIESSSPVSRSGASMTGGGVAVGVGTELVISAPTTSLGGHAGNPTAQSSRYLSALLRALRPSLDRIASRSRNTCLNTVLPATLCARAVPVATLSPPSRATAAWGRTHGSSRRSGFFSGRSRRLTTMDGMPARRGSLPPRRGPIIQPPAVHLVIGASLHVQGDVIDSSPRSPTAPRRVSEGQR